MKEARPYYRGLPTEPDVDRLMKTYPAEAGKLISHAEIEAVIGQKQDTSRYRTVLAAWRRKLFREENVDTEMIRNEGMRFLYEAERVNQSLSEFGRNVRGMGKSLDRITAVRTNMLGPQELIRHDHGRRLIAQTLEVAQQAHKELTTIPPTPQLPRPPIDNTPLTS